MEGAHSLSPVSTTETAGEADLQAEQWGWKPSSRAPHQLRVEGSAEGRRQDVSSGKLGRPQAGKGAVATWHNASSGRLRAPLATQGTAQASTGWGGIARRGCPSSEVWMHHRAPQELCHC